VPGPDTERRAPDQCRVIGEKVTIACASTKPHAAPDAQPVPVGASRDRLLYDGHM
jgi:hypothetical protein